MRLTAQVTVDVTIGQEQFLPGEELVAAVHVTNHSGQALRLGEGEDWLKFSIESRDGGIVGKHADPPVAGRFVLESSRKATKRVDLAPYFALNRPGRFDIIATVRLKGWDREIQSPPRHFDIIEGTKLWEQEIGVPTAQNSTNAAAPPEVRKYILQQARYLRSQLRLYLRVTDVTASRVYRVAAVGPMISFSEPEPQVDKLSNLHVLYQNGPHSFSYTLFNPDGQLLTRRTYDWTGTRPRLKVDADGNLSVAGGVRRITANDFPPSETPTPPDVAVPKP